MKLETKSFGSIILNSSGSDVYPSPVSSNKQVSNNCKNLGIIIFFWSIPAANVLNPWIPEANVYTLISPAVYGPCSENFFPLQFAVKQKQANQQMNINKLFTTLSQSSWKYKTSGTVFPILTSCLANNIYYVIVK